MTMNYPMIDLEHLVTDDSEARRTHERYFCKGINIRFSSLVAPYLKSVDEPTHIATITDISIDGLAIRSNKPLSAGELLSVVIESPAKETNEKVKVQVMWCNASTNESYLIGLKVLVEGEMVDSSMNNEQELFCSHCGEASFYLEDKTSEQQSVTTHSCCRCGHSHYISDVIALNRK